MRIGGLLSTTLLDYPGKLACTVCTQGCNMRCPYCQNGSLVLPVCFEAPLDEEAVLAKIQKRASVLEGVCVSGGEPTLQPDLAGFLKKIKALGLSVKLDSNGSRPDILEKLRQDGLIDMVAMDIKSSRIHYAAAAGLHAASRDHENLLQPYEESIDFLMHSGIAYEFRTTLVKGLHTLDDMKDISEWIAGAKAYYLQSYEESANVISLLQKKNAPYSAFSPSELEIFLETAAKNVPSAALRGVTP